MTFEEWYKKSDCELTGVSIGIARCIFQAGVKSNLNAAKELQKEISETETALDMFLEENEHLKRDNGLLAKRVCELRSDLSREKSKNEELIKKIESYNKANEWHYVKDGDLPNTEFGRVDITVAYINAYENTCKKDCCFDGTNFIYWDARKPVGWKKVDIFGKIYAWKYPEKLPELPKEIE